jgi:hypothetical protein
MNGMKIKSSAKAALSHLWPLDCLLDYREKSIFLSQQDAVNRG